MKFMRGRLIRYKWNASEGSRPIFNLQSNVLFAKGVIFDSLLGVSGTIDGSEGSVLRETNKEGKDTLPNQIQSSLSRETLIHSSHIWSFKQGQKKRKR